MPVILVSGERNYSNEIVPKIHYIARLNNVSITSLEHQIANPIDYKNIIKKIRRTNVRKMNYEN